MKKEKAGGGKVRGGLVGGGFLGMVMAVLGTVLYVTMFDTVFDAVQALAITSGVSSYTAFSTILAIAPTILFISGLFAGGIAYYKSAKSYGESGSDSAGFMRMILGILEIVLFVTMFSTILSGMETLRTEANISGYIGFSTVVGIAPTVLFLSGIFAGASTAYGGAQAFKRRRE